MRAKAWRGAITVTPALETLLDVARNGDDLRVRAAAIEIERAALNIMKTAPQVDALFGRIAASPREDRQAISILGILANRGAEVDRLHQELRRLTHSEDDVVRVQAYAAIANIGTDDTVRDLVDGFHHDPSFDVRINGGGLARQRAALAGMVRRARRRDDRSVSQIRRRAEIERPEKRYLEPPL